MAPAMDPVRTSGRARSGAVALVAAVAMLLWTAAAGHGATVQTHTVPQPSAGLNTLVTGPDGNLWFSESNATGGSYHVGSISPSGQFGPTINVPVSQFDSDQNEGPDWLTSSGGSLWFRTDLDQIYRYGSGQLTNVLGGPDFVESDFTASIGPSDRGGIWATDWDGGDQPGDQTDLRRYAAGAAAGATPAFVPATYRATWFPTPLVLGPGGSVWYSDDSDYFRATSDSGATQSFPISGIPLGAPNAMAFDGKGDLWFGSEYPGSGFTSADDGAIGSLPAGAASATATKLPEHDVPTSIARGPDGNMYFGWLVGPSTTGPHGGIGQIDTATGKVTLADLGGLEPASVTFAKDGGLWFIDPALNQVDRVDVSQLFPNGGGGGGGGGGSGGRLPQAPRLTLAIPHQTLAAVRARRRLTTTCRLAAAGRCAVRATLAHATARKLELVPHAARRRGGAAHPHKPGSSKPYTLASASHKLAHRGRATLRLKLSARAARALKQVHRLRVTVVATSSAAGHRSRTTRPTLTLR
jgi:streptogramin lyase